MTDTSFCPNCGARVSARAHFCTACGAELDEFQVPDEERPAPTFPTEAVIRAVPPPAPPPGDDAEFVTPAPSFPTEAVIGAVPPKPAAGKPPPPAQPGEFAGLLKQQLAVPGILAALIAGGVAAGVVLAAGLVLALITPDNSIIGVAGVDASIAAETFRQAVGTLLAPMVDPGLLLAGSRRIHPLILLAVPLTALALATRWQLGRTEGAAPVVRLGWALAVAVPFSVLMLVFAVLGGSTESTDVSASAGYTFLLGLLWGALGGLLGAATVIDVRPLVTVPPPARTALRAVTAALRPLAAVVLACTALALVGWLVQVAANAGEVRAGRALPTALVEETAFAPEHGIHLTALAAGALFRPDATINAVGLPFPVDDPNALPGEDGSFRIFAYGDALPAVVFLPVLVLLICLVALGALYAGFAAARAVGERRAGPAAAWGAITGPAWAVTMVAAVVLGGGLLHGDAGDGSVFGLFLLGGALLGAAGGALSATGSPPGPEPGSSGSRGRARQR